MHVVIGIARFFREWGYSKNSISQILGKLRKTHYIIIFNKRFTKACVTFSGGRKVKICRKFAKILKNSKENFNYFLQIFLRNIEFGIKPVSLKIFAVSAEYPLRLRSGISCLISLGPSREIAKTQNRVFSTWNVLHATHRPALKFQLGTSFLQGVYLRV